MNATFIWARYLSFLILELRFKATVKESKDMIMTDIHEKDQVNNSKLKNEL
jgi:hypothetical protein